METNLSEQQLIEYNRLGLIPGPGETIECFNERVIYCLHLKQHLLKESIPEFDAEESCSREMMVPASRRIRALYGISPDWIPVFFSNHKLSFWHGGCAWIFQMMESSPTAALIQLRSQFQRSDRYLGIYHRDELLAHELAHVGRMAFQEPKYEEFFAYQTSTSSFRRWFGPILQSSIESIFFVLILFLIIVIDFFLISQNHYEAYMIALWIKIIPVGMIAIALIRLWYRHFILGKAEKNLEEVLRGKEKVSAVAYRLQDEEIHLFASMTPIEIEDYAVKRSKKELRWHCIRKIYF